MYYNKTLIAGHAGRDFELKYSTNGEAYGGTSIAISKRWKSKEGEQRERTDWVRITAFGKTAESMSNHIKKGTGVFIEGAITTSEYTDKKTGEKRTSTEVAVDRWQFTGPKPSTPETAATPAKQASSEPPGTPSDPWG